MREADVLEKVLANIVGFDLDPLAVMSARTNYLLAIGELIQHRRGEVNIPGYLADSILTPAQMQELVQEQFRLMGPEERRYRFKTVVGEFAIPGSLVTAQHVDQLAALLEESVELKRSPGEFRTRVLAVFPLVEDRDQEDLDVLEDLYARLYELDKAGVNGIWARIIKNAFAPLFAGKFDYVAGNPPWVNWDSLPDGYRRDLIPLNQNVYLLFPHTGLRARHGSSEIDTSTLMTYVSLDRYLAGSGRLGFVITQTLFKTDAGKGFRRFDIRGDTPVAALHVDDMVALQPFEGAANRTSVVVMEKGRETKYPVPYTLWRRRTQRTELRQDATLDAILALTRRSNWMATPIVASDSTSPWMTARSKALGAMQKLVGVSPYRAHVGVHTGGANGVYWVSIVESRPDGMLVVANHPEEGRKPVEAIQAAIEATFVHPLLRGRDVSRWSAVPSLHIIAPQDPEHPGRGIPEAILKDRYPKSYGFLARFQTELGKRAHFIKYLKQSGAPWYSLYDIKAYTYVGNKVVWREQASRFTAAVVPDEGGPVILPDHKLMLVDVDSAEEAHYLCAILNSTPVALLVRTYAVETQISTHVLNYVAVPQFDLEEEAHGQLSSLSRQAHDAMAAGNGENVAQIEVQIDRLAAQLWDLSTHELREIQQSLAELRG